MFASSEAKYRQMLITQVAKSLVYVSKLAPNLPATAATGPSRRGVVAACRKGDREAPELVGNDSTEI